jgi:hemoglobin-like flavoprotein
MTADQVYLLRKTFEVVERNATVAALVFYRRLFEIAPQVRPMFTTNIEEQSQKLMEMLGIVLSLMGRPGALEKELEESGLRHATYGVRDEHYPIVGAALLHMLEHQLGTQWTPAVAAAWSDFYSYMAQCMQRGAAQAQFQRSQRPQRPQQSPAGPVKSTRSGPSS